MSVSISISGPAGTHVLVYVYVNIKTELVYDRVLVPMYFVEYETVLEFTYVVVDMTMAVYDEVNSDDVSESVYVSVCVWVHMLVSINDGDNVREYENVSTNVEVDVLIETSDAETVCVSSLAFA